MMGHRQVDQLRCSTIPQSRLSTMLLDAHRCRLRVKSITLALPHPESALPQAGVLTHSRISPACSQAKEQSSCSEWTGIPLQTEHCYRDRKTLMGAFDPTPPGHLPGWG